MRSAANLAAIHREPGGAIWFGTDGGGAARYDPGTGEWQRFRAQNGLGTEARSGSPHSAAAT
jgi:streptogramin lyase